MLDDIKLYRDKPLLLIRSFSRKFLKLRDAFCPTSLLLMLSQHCAYVKALMLKNCGKGRAYLFTICDIFYESVEACPLRECDVGNAA